MADNIVLAEPFASLWRGQDAFAAVAALNGDIFRQLDGRRTFRCEINGRGYFVKHHTGIGWAEVIKNLLCLRLPVTSAHNEWQAIHRLTALGVPTMTAAAFGCRGSSPAGLESFIITEELAPTVSLEDFCCNWPDASNRPPLALKRALLTRVADMTGRMHRGGVNHRDLYLCHFLLHLEPAPTATNLRLSLIDLHRAQCRPQIPRRWQQKDLAGLYFSALDIGLTQRDRYRFLKTYFAAPLREVLASHAPLLMALETEAQRLKARYVRKFQKVAA